MLLLMLSVRTQFFLLFGMTCEKKISESLKAELVFKPMKIYVFPVVELAAIFDFNFSFYKHRNFG